MALVKATIKQRFLDLYALAKSSELTDDEFADAMADLMIATITDSTVNTSGLADTGGDTLTSNTTLS